MHRLLLAAACAACVSTGLGAQGQTTPRSPSTGAPGTIVPGSGPTAAAPAGADARVVMTGCIDRADQLVPAGASTIGTTVDSLDFVMTHAELANSPHTVSPEPTGTSGTAAPGYNGIGAIYRLDGPLTTLNPHVGHRVEITGTREAGAPGAKPPSANAVNPSAANAPIIKVDSVKLLSETCAQ